MRALITGLHGFIARHIEHALLAQGATVMGIVRADADDPGRSVAPSIGALADVDRLCTVVRDFAPTHVFHCAGSLRRPGQAPAELVHSNVGLTAQLMEALLRSGLAPVVVLPSSAAVYGRPTVLPIDETHPVAPVDQYGTSKAAQELVVEQHHRAWACPIRILRVFNVVGPGQPATLVASSIARQIVRMERGLQAEVRVGDLSTRRDLVDVRDVALACIAAARHDTERMLVNVCSGTSTAMSTCFDLLSAAAHVPVTLAREAAATRAHDVPDHRGDPARIVDRLGWRAGIPLERSMLDLLEAWRAEAELGLSLARSGDDAEDREDPEIQLASNCVRYQA